LATEPSVKTCPWHVN